LRPAAVETRAAENTKDSAKDGKNNKKFKPEKISIEEHIAVRIGEKNSNQPKADVGTAPKAPFAKKHPRRRKSEKAPGGAAVSKEKPSTQPLQSQSAQPAKEAVPKKANPGPFKRERPRPAHESANETQKKPQKDPQSGPNRYRSHPRPQNAERGRNDRSREKQGGKEDS
jgi:hypothetical protein